jgi:hypothetical protein
LFASVPAGKEHDLRGLHVDERRDLLARAIDGLARLRAELVTAGSVAVLVAQERQHRLEHALVERCGRVVIEVDVCHGAVSL